MDPSIHPQKSGEFTEELFKICFHEINQAKKVAPAPLPLTAEILISQLLILFIILAEKAILLTATTLANLDV